MPGIVLLIHMGEKYIKGFRHLRRDEEREMACLVSFFGLGIIETRALLRRLELILHSIFFFKSVKYQAL